MKFELFFYKAFNIKVYIWALPEKNGAVPSDEEAAAKQ